MGNFLLTGAFIGIAGALLSLWGNPANTGFCVSCFMENIAGSLGLHGNVRMQYLRPEIFGILLGAFVMAAGRREFRATSGSSPLLRFFVGMLLIVGCAVFMGCPIKMLLRIAAGDGTALIGLPGLAAGVFIGLRFNEAGFSIGKPMESPWGNGLLIPAAAVFLLVLLLAKPDFIAISEKGAAALRAPIPLSLIAGLVAGALAQRTGFCVTGGLSRLFLWGVRDVKTCPKSSGLLAGIASFLLAATIANVATEQFSPGWHGQPSSNESHGWNFLGMLLVGFGSVLIKGCPFRQLVLAGQGDGDAGAAVLGMLAGAAVVQNWGIGGGPAGTPVAGKVAVLLCLAMLLAIGMLYRRRGTSIAPEYQTGLD